MPTILAFLLLFVFSGLGFAQTTGPGIRTFVCSGGPTVNTSCRPHDECLDNSDADENNWAIWKAKSCVAGAAVWVVATGGIGSSDTTGVSFANLPASPVGNIPYFVTDLADDTAICSGGGDGTIRGWCIWDIAAEQWLRDHSLGLTTILTQSTFKGVNSGPFIIQPLGALDGENATKTTFDATTPVGRCEYDVDQPCSPADVDVYDGQSFRIRSFNTDDPPVATIEGECLNTAGVLECTGILATTAAGIFFADLPAAPTDGMIRFVMDLADPSTLADPNVCSEGGGAGEHAGDCWWSDDAGAWLRKSPGSLQGITNRSTPRGWDDLPVGQELVIQPLGKLNGPTALKLEIGDCGGDLCFYLSENSVELPYPMPMFVPFDAPNTCLLNYHDGAALQPKLCIDNTAGAGTPLDWLKPTAGYADQVTETGAVVYNDVNDKPEGLVGTTGQMLFFTTGAAPTAGTLVRTAQSVFFNVATTTDNQVMIIAPAAMTVTGIACTIARSSGAITNGPTFALKDGDANAMTHDAPVCAAVTEDAAYKDVTAANTLAKGEILLLDNTAVATDGDDDYGVAILFTIP